MGFFTLLPLGFCFPCILLPQIIPQWKHHSNVAKWASTWQWGWSTMDRIQHDSTLTISGVTMGRLWVKGPTATLAVHIWPWPVWLGWVNPTTHCGWIMAWPLWKGLQSTYCARLEKLRPRKCRCCLVFEGFISGLLCLLPTVVRSTVPAVMVDND